MSNGFKKRNFSCLVTPKMDDMRVWTRGLIDGKYKYKKKEEEEKEEEKNCVSFVSPGEIVGGSLGCDGCGPTECFRVTHKSSSGPYLCTHTHSRKEEERK